MSVLFNILFYIMLFLVAILFANLTDYILRNAPISWYYDYGEMPTAGQLEAFEKEKRKYKIFSVKIFCHALLFFGIFVLAFTQIGLFNVACTVSLAVPMLFLLSASDVKYKILPDQYTLWLFLLFLIHFIINFKSIDGENLMSMFFGFVIGGGFFLLLGLIGSMIYKQEVIGMGDAKLSAVLGLFLGWKMTIVLLVLTIFLAGIFALIMLILHRIKKSDYIPLCPFISVAFLLTAIFKSQILALINLYMSIFI